MNYAACREALERAEADLSASEFHGTLCALLCTRAPPRIDSWLGEIVACEHPSGGWNASLRDAAERAMRALEGGDCDLELLLPEDDAPLGERGRALAEWCAGFLYGLGLAGERARDGLSDEAREVVSDLVEFTRLDDGEEASEAAEAAFAEIAEYVRVGVILIYEELMRGAGATGDRRWLH